MDRWGWLLVSYAVTGAVCWIQYDPQEKPYTTAIIFLSLCAIFSFSMLVSLLSESKSEQENKIENINSLLDNRIDREVEELRQMVKELEEEVESKEIRRRRRK